VLQTITKSPRSFPGSEHSVTLYNTLHQETAIHGHIHTCMLQNLGGLSELPLRVCLFVHVSSCVSLRACLFVCVSSCVSLRACLFVCVSSCVSLRVCLFVCVSSCVSVRVCLFVCVCSCVSVRVCLFVCVSSCVSVRVCLVCVLYTSSCVASLHLCCRVLQGVPGCCRVW